jgi:hypothetical protein
MRVTVIPGEVLEVEVIVWGRPESVMLTIGSDDHQSHAFLTTPQPPVTGQVPLVWRKEDPFKEGA